MEVVMIRHTRVGVDKGTCYGWSDVPVAETFEQEAAVTKGNLDTFGEFDAVFSSPLTRALRLAVYCGYPEAIKDERLKEMNMGDWEMLKFDEIKDRRLQQWYDNYMTLPTTNGESFPMLYDRVSPFLDELRGKPFHRVAIFAHGGVLMCGGIYTGMFTKEDCFNHLAAYGGIQAMSL